MKTVHIGKSTFEEHASGFYFHAETVPTVRDIIARMPRAQHVRLFYGDTQTGQAWPEENDICGYVGRSCGPVKVPLLIANNRSAGVGGAILDHCIVAIVCIKSGRWLYKHAGFDPGQWTTAPASAAGFECDVLHDGKVHARFKRAERGRRYCAFMRGERFSF